MNTSVFRFIERHVTRQVTPTISALILTASLLKVRIGTPLLLTLQGKASIVQTYSGASANPGRAPGYDAVHETSIMKQPATQKAYIVIIALVVLVVVAFNFADPADTRAIHTQAHPAGSVQAFFDDAVINWIVPYKPGGGYDEYVRLIVPYLERYTGARVRVRNIPGAGGLRGVSELLRSPANGLTIGMINGSGLITSHIAGVGDSDHATDELSFLARIVTETRVLSLPAKGLYSSFDDILNAKQVVRIGATGLGGSTYVDAITIGNAFSLNMKLIHGFDNSPSIRHAMLGGKIDGAWSSWGSARDAVLAGSLVAVLQSGRTRSPALPDVPTVFEYSEKMPDSQHAEEFLNAWEALNEIGRAIVAPSGIDADKREFLQEALRQALVDPQLLDAATRSHRPVNYVRGDELEDIVKRALLMPEEMQQLFMAAARGGTQ